jgi:glycosyltransferase involved in cell wall biosynthesis
MNRRSILFISHDAGRTGAPFVLLHFLGWLKANTDFELTTLSRRDGPLLPEFAKLGETIVLAPNPATHPGWIRGAARRLGWDRLHRMRSLQTLRNRPFQLLYSNTVTNGDLLAKLSRPGTPVITHIHELTYWIERSGRKNWEQVRRHTTHFVAASEAVSSNLIRHYQIPSSQISVVHEFIPAEKCGAQVETEQRSKIRATMGIPAEAFVVVGSGMETWRKGKDLFVQLAACIRRRHPPRLVYFVWVGSPGDEDDQRQLTHDVTAAGLADCVRWTGEVNNPLDYFSCFDAFVMVSREDPFPLVCLEAALLGLPIVCFANAGGAPELVEADCGFVVDYLDIDAMADKVQLLAQDETLRRRLGSCAAGKVRARFSLEASASRLLEIMQRISDPLR